MEASVDAQNARKLELARYEDLANYNEDVDNYLSWYDGADRQLNVADDLFGEQIRRLEDEEGWYRQLLASAETIQHTDSTSPIFATLSLSPRGGLYGKAGEVLADARYQWSKSTSRRGYQTHHYGWYGKALRVVTAVPRAFSETKAPSWYNPADPDHWKVADAWLKRVKGLDGWQRVKLVEDLMRADTEAARVAQVKRIESIAIAKISDDAGIAPENIRSIVARTMG
ncbi:hypothetical protein, partial [Streptomyces anulatus]|uniref:hypothetical protein n=1 Tax=Streptomyces anulatus TaxID=1892 RepID=UPI0034490CB8